MSHLLAKCAQDNNGVKTLPPQCRQPEESYENNILGELTYESIITLCGVSHLLAKCTEDNNVVMILPPLYATMPPIHYVLRVALE